MISPHRESPLRVPWQAFAIGLVAVVLTSGCDLIADRTIAQRSLADSLATAQQDSMACAVAKPAGLSTAKAALAEQDCLRRIRVLRRVSVDMQYAADMMASVPEYHDEQRLPDGNGGYGPPAFIFASPNIGGFVHEWQLDEHGARGALWAVAVVDAPAGTTLPDSYNELGLVAGGRSCIWLARENGALTARVSHQPDDTKACDPNAGFRRMHVSPDPNSVVTVAADQPPVARFTETRVGRPLFGMRCLLRWCDVGPTPPSGSGPPPWAAAPVQLVGGGAGPNSPIHERVKGWHDSQVLSLNDGGTLKPNGPRATFVPARSIGDRSMAYYRGQTWHAVGTLHILGPTTGTQYETWGLRQGRNELSLRFENNVWQMQVSSGNSSRVWNNVHRHEHYDAAVPGTARFRWISYDDGFWVPCGQGCCRADGAY
jgi:hypothetical protein